jgi:hypothetical protein
LPTQWQECPALYSLTVARVRSFQADLLKFTPHTACAAFQRLRNIALILAEPMDGDEQNLCLLPDPPDHVNFGENVPGHIKFRRLAQWIIVHSQSAETWPVALQQWSVISIWRAIDPHECICETIHIERCRIYNIITGATAIIGNHCIVRFTDEEYDPTVKMSACQLIDFLEATYPNKRARNCYVAQLRVATVANQTRRALFEFLHEPSQCVKPCLLVLAFRLGILTVETTLAYAEIATRVFSETNRKKKTSVLHSALSETECAQIDAYNELLLAGFSPFRPLCLCIPGRPAVPVATPNGNVTYKCWKTGRASCGFKEVADIEQMLVYVQLSDDARKRRVESRARTTAKSIVTGGATQADTDDVVSSEDDACDIDDQAQEE